MTTENGWPDERLFDAWNIRDVWIPKVLEWPEEMKDWDSQQKERWGVLMAKRFIFRHLEGARVIHRGDCLVWGTAADCSFKIHGDLDIAWEGRSPIMEVKAYLPAVRLRGGRAPASQGLDWPRYMDYRNEQERTGRPLYVVWVWPDAERREIYLRGDRIDRLAWPPHESSLNRLRNAKGSKMCYWHVEGLLPMSELTIDITDWSGAPFQEALV